MQKTIYGLVLSCLIFVTFPACNNELDIAADWKEIAIVYALLDPTQDVNYVRIQKAYLDEKTGALAFSDIPDSLYYDTLDVKVTEFYQGVEGNTYSLKKVDGNKIGIPKDDGIFSNEYNYLYQLNADIKPSSYFNTYSYKLTVFNPETGNLVTSSALSIGNATMKAPVSANSTKVLIRGDSNGRVYTIYTEGIFARSYDLSMRIYVEEINIEDTLSRDTVELKWDLFKGKKTQSLSGFAEVSFSNYTLGFYNLLGSKLDSTLDVKRRLLGLDMVLTGIGDDLYTYISVNEPSIGIVQKKPEYTNINNGFGIFSSRYVTIYEDRKFDERTLQAVMNHDATKALNFVSY